MESSQLLENSWYRRVEQHESIQQGEVITNFPLIAPSKALMKDVSVIDNKELLVETADLLISLQLNDVVVISQSCDIENDKLAMITICPVGELTVLKSKFLSERGKKESEFKGWINNVIGSKNRGKFAVQACSIVDAERELSIIDFTSPFTVPLEYAKTIVRRRKQRLALVPPYRESMAVAYASTLSRVAIANDCQIKPI